MMKLEYLYYTRWRGGYIDGNDDELINDVFLFR